ncbi:unnamed protein product [Lactuca virosa]|uniref:Uncharacterized protein n=1 Tax=Lactuca virosa TaxID=75947 RepID=A0AAU9LYA7_9ASTR|nr:unnamed protein product [Lactuca virosa]
MGKQRGTVAVTGAGGGGLPVPTASLIRFTSIDLSFPFLCNRFDPRNENCEVASHVLIPILQSLPPLHKRMVVFPTVRKDYHFLTAHNVFDKMPH